MTLYGAVLFLHILAAMGIVGGSCVLHFFHARMLRARAREVLLEWAGAAKTVSKLMPIFSIVLLLCGIYLTLSRWNFEQPWILTSLVLLVCIGLASPLVVEPRMKRAVVAAVGGASLAEVKGLLSDPVYSFASSIFTIEAVGIVLLMASKPDLTLTLAIVVVAALVGAVLGRPHPVAAPQMVDATTVSSFDAESGR